VFEVEGGDGFLDFEYFLFLVSFKPNSSSSIFLTNDTKILLLLCRLFKEYWGKKS
jgi:hypothetical protein